MLENTKNILIIIVVFIFLIKSCQMIIDFQNTDIENFTQKNDIITKNLYPNYDKLLNNIKKLKMENKYSIDLLSTNPPIFTVSNFLSKKESDELIHLLNSSQILKIILIEIMLSLIIIREMILLKR